MTALAVDTIRLPRCSCGGTETWLIPHERFEHGKLVLLGQFLSCIPCGAIRVYAAGDGKA